MVTDPLLQVPLEPAFRVPQASEVGLAASEPLTAVPEAVIAGLPKLELMVTVVLLAPALWGANVTPNVQVLPAVSTLLAVQVEPDRTKSVASERLVGVPFKVTEAPEAVTVTVPVHDTEVPTPVLPQLTDDGLAVKVAPVPVTVPEPAVPAAGVTVIVSEAAPALCGVKEDTVNRLQLAPEASN